MVCIEILFIFKLCMIFIGERLFLVDLFIFLFFLFIIKLCVIIVL